MNILELNENLTRNYIQIYIHQVPLILDSVTDINIFAVKIIHMCVVNY